MFQTLITFVWKNYIYLLFALTIIVFFLTIREQAISKQVHSGGPAQVFSGFLPILSFLNVAVSAMLTVLFLEIFRNASLSEPLNYVDLKERFLNPLL